MRRLHHNRPGLLVVLLLVLLFGVACTSRGAQESPAEAYPPAEVKLPTVSSMLYPDFQDGAQVEWDPFLAMLFNGEVIKVVQSADLKVTFTLRDGRSLITMQPAEGELQNILASCGEICKNIEVVKP